MKVRTTIVYETDIFGIEDSEDLTDLEREFKDNAQLMDEMIGIGWESPVSIRLEGIGE